MADAASTLQRIRALAENQPEWFECNHCLESPFSARRAHYKWYQCEKGHLLCEYCWNDVRGKVSCYVCTTPMVPTIRCRALEFIADIMLDSAHEAHNTNEMALVGVAESRAEASGCPGGGEESLLLETAAAVSRRPQSRWLLRRIVTRLLWHMAHQRHVEMSWKQSSQCLFRLAVPFRVSCRSAMTRGIRRERKPW